MRAPTLFILAALVGGVDLAEAKKLLAGNNEGAVRNGAKMCLELNNAEAAEAMLRVLSGSQPHYRDIAFEYLEKLANPYAIAVVENEVTANKDERMRAWCADLCGAYAGKGRLDPLHRALGDSSLLVKSAAARALGRIGAKESASRLAALKTHTDPGLRATAWIAWARCDAKKNGAGFAAALGDRDAGVRAALLAALPEILPEEILARSRAAFADPDWRVRLQATQNVIAVGSKATQESVPALIDRVGDPRPLVSASAEAALRAITGKQIGGRRSWQAWWEASGGANGPPAASAPSVTDSKPGTSTATYYGLPIESDHVAFLIDRGETMGHASGTGETKLTEAVSELESTLKSLPPGAHFNVFAYASEVSAWEKKPQPVGPKTIAAALAFLRAQSTAGRKNIWEALLAPLADPTVDTIYLMSDGEPQDSEYVHYNRVVDHLKRLNALRKVVVHTISISDPSWNDATKEWYRSQLREIAKGTGGRYLEL